MFTGIVEELGRVTGISKGQASAKLEIEAPSILEGTRVGDSIATNGVCLTATGIRGTRFTADVMHETLRRSSLGSLRPGSRVNLERAMPANGRFGGHIVSGHIDGTGTIARIESDDNAIWYTIDAPSPIMRYIVEKGSVAIDGISLTVARIERKNFAVSVIPHTREVTNLAQKHPGDVVNLECDVVGKYVERLLGLTARDESRTPPESGGLTLEALAMLE